MSHTTHLKNVVIRDVGALRSAVAELKAGGVDCDLLEDAKPRMYYSNQGQKCEYVLKLNKGKYDVGFKLQEDGTYAPLLDTWAGNVGNQIGADAEVCPMPGTEAGRAQHAIGQFMQSYSKNAAINAAVMQGYSVESADTDGDGNVHLVFGGM